MNGSDENAVSKPAVPPVRGVLTSAGETTTVSSAPYEPDESEAMRALIKYLKDKKQKDAQGENER